MRQPDDLALAALAAATPKEAIQNKPGRGQSGRLSYVTARFVMDRLDAAVGAENWQDRYEDRTDGSVRCGIGIRIGDEWIWKWDVGTESDIESEKGVHSDAFKRAGVKWGIGRDLYPDHASAAPQPTPPQSQPSNGHVAAGRIGTLRPAATTVPPEPEWLGDVIPAARPQAAPQSMDEGSCPQHGKPWRENAKGFYCATKVGEGWCDERPTQRWVNGRGAVAVGR